MPNLVVDPSFELDASEWVLGGNAFYDSSDAQQGNRCLNLFSRRSTILGNAASTARQTIAADAGVSYPLRAYLKADAAHAQQPLSVYWDPLDGSGLQEIFSTLPTGPGWIAFDLGSVIPPLPQFDLLIATFVPAVNGVSGNWLVDNVLVGTEVTLMARMMAELAMSALLAELQLSLNTEIAGIQSERGDGVTLPAVKSWFAFRRPPDPDTVEIQVWLERAEHPRWTVDLSQTIEGQRGPLITEIDARVVLVHANRENASVAQMVQRDWRYYAAIERVIQNQPKLRTASTVTVYEVEPDYDVRQRMALPQDPHALGAVGALVRMRLQESHTGEGTPSGGVPPAAQLEVV